MDPVPGSEHKHDAQPKTAIEEGMLRIGGALDSAIKDYKRLPLLSLRKRFYMQGVIKALTIVFDMLHELHHKYDNSHGGWN